MKMYCKQCGTQNKESANFCEKCGSPLETQSLENQGILIKTTTENSEEMGAGNNKKRKKRIMIIAIALATIVACVIGVTLYSNNQKQAQYMGKLETGDKYLQKLDYEKAETAYLEAIEIQPKRDSAYIKLADVYVVQNKYDEAINILKTGEEKAGGEKIEDKLKEVQKEAEKGDTETQYKAYYDLCMKYQKKYGKPTIKYIETSDELQPSQGYMLGLCVVKLYDFDMDGNLELLLAYSDKEESGYVDYKYEIWIWQNDKLSNALPATRVNRDQDGCQWIETIKKNDEQYLYFDQAANYIRLIGYKGNKFASKYTYEMKYPEYGDNFTYFINEKKVDQRTYVQELPQSNFFTLDHKANYYESKSDAMLIVFNYIGNSYAESVFDETAENLNLMRGNI